MSLYKVKWNIATTECLFRGTYIVQADDDDHAIERAKSELGPEASAASFSSEKVGSTIFELKRSETLLDFSANKPLPEPAAGTFGSPLFVYEIAARANVVARTEKTAFERFASAVRSQQSDGEYCKYFRAAILDKEELSKMSAFERHEIEKSFRRVQGGGVSPR